MTNKEFLDRIGIEFRVARTRQRLSIREISNMTGLDNNTIGKIERGQSEAKILTYKRIADALGVELKTFL